MKRHRGAQSGVQNRESETRVGRVLRQILGRGVPTRVWKHDPLVNQVSLKHIDPLIYLTCKITTLPFIILIIPK